MKARWSGGWILVWVLFVAASVGGTGCFSMAEASSEVSVKNETGYTLQGLKYVRTEGSQKLLVGQTRLASGGIHAFALTKPGNHVAYITFLRNGRVVYAKGTAYYIPDETKATLTLQTVVLSEKGNSISEINREEFDAIK